MSRCSGPHTARTGVRQSTCMYTEVSFEDISTSGDEEYIPKQK